MAGGWARDGAVQDQIDDTVNDAVAAARNALGQEDGRDFCQDCGERIPAARRKALPGARSCVSCQSERDSSRRASGFNRRGSKDSQLR